MGIELLNVLLIKNYCQRAGIADGGGFYIRPPETAAWLLKNLNIKN
jgi:hypothetical protein